MEDEGLGWPTVKYTLLYALVIVPLGLFVGMLTCVGVFAATGTANSDYLWFIGPGSGVIVFCGSIYMAYKLGREKALGNKIRLEPHGKGETPGDGDQGQA
ncbi:MAG TPA: hypothetical protein DCZ92_13930 [Elusimicrobia bacterium]|nr:MAG: hypothetical protein A2016_05495 [Elusimicrobia bacterium GWF2_62_30]HBA61882.1 hypothetical protein [Elusimicrobiota bacterium]